MGRSIVVEVRKAVVAGISDLLDEKKVSVTYGWRGGDDERREQIYTNRPRATHRPAAMKTGRNFRNESMEFDVVVLVVDPTDPPDVVDERVLELGEVIEEYLADHKQGEGWGIEGLNSIYITAFEMQNQLTPTGSLTVAQWTATYDARLT